MERIATSSARLNDMFMNALASVQFQDAVRQQIEQIIAALDRLDDHASTLARRLDEANNPDFELTPLARQLERQFDNYVMSSQRASHHAAMGLAEPAAGGASMLPKVELF